MAQRPPANRQTVERLCLLYLSHYPFCAPADYVNLYDPAKVELPVNWERENWANHPAIRVKREKMGLDDGFTEAEVRWVTAVYFGMVSFLDAQVGKVLDALAASPYADNTVVVYSTDHGEMLGAQGQWFKGTMYEGSAGIPMIMAGPGVPQGHVCSTPVNLVDIYPTVVETVGADYTDADESLPGQNLVTIANLPDRDRVVLSEYHSVAKTGSTFMLRNHQYKYVEHIGYPPQLFDMHADPNELVDLAPDPAFAGVVTAMAALMREYFSPEEVWETVSSYQQAQLERLGGVDAMLEKLANWPGGRPYTPAPPEFR